MKMGFLFTSESVSEGHPDKVSDQISDAILDEFLRRDANSKVACETLCTTGLVVVAGEVRSDAYVDVQGVARRVIERIGYTKSEYQFDCNSCGILSAIHEQSSDINQGVVRELVDRSGIANELQTHSLKLVLVTIMNHKNFSLHSLVVVRALAQILFCLDKFRSFVCISTEH